MGDQVRMNANGDVVTPVEVYGSNIQLPVDIQSHLTTTIQTQVAVTVAATTGVNLSTAWVDTNGYTSISSTVRSDATHAMSLKLVWSNDGTNIHNTQTVATGTGFDQGGVVDTRARYVKVQIENTDAAAHVMNAWVYLKA